MKKKRVKNDFKINFSILDPNTEQVFFKVKGMKAKDFLTNWEEFKRKIE